jgi:hypothetical protein
MCDAPEPGHRPGATIFDLRGTAQYARPTLPSPTGLPMPKPSSEPTPQHDLATPLDDLQELGNSAFETFDPSLDEPDASRPTAPPPRGAPRWALIGGAAAIVILASGLFAYRAHHRARVLRAGLARADVLLTLDTAAGYREAASLLEPLAAMDPIRAASVQAYAMAMLFADYQEAPAEARADALLVEPSRAGEVPREAHLASAAIALGRREAGNALTATARAGGSPYAQVLAARVAFLAGNLSAAVDPASGAAEAGLPAGLALRGDLLRRTRQDPAGARAAYQAALRASPLHPRATFGLAKLALSSQAPAAEAEAALRHVLDDREATPAPERGRAAVHLAALRLRASDRVGAVAALASAGLEGQARTWAEAASAVEATHRGWYRAVEGAPASLRSASDDDPGELAPIAPSLFEPPKPAPPPPPKAAPASTSSSRLAAVKSPKPATKHGVAPKRTAATTRKATTAHKTPAAKSAPAKGAAASKKKSAKKTSQKQTAEQTTR